MNRRFTNNPMNPEHHQRHPREQRDEVDELSQGQGTGTPPTPGAQPQHVGGYSITAPNQSRRDKLQATANKELEDLEKWKEEHRYGPINLTPIELGGSISQTEARQQQQRKQQLSKYQQRAKKEEYDRKKREQEEAELQKMKAIQREKANKLEETRRQQQEQRKAQLQTNHYHTNQQFFQRMDPNRYSANSYPTYSSPQPSASWNDLLEGKESEMEEERQKQLKEDHRRKNNTFLDKLEMRSQMGENSPSSSLGLPANNDLSEHDTTLRPEVAHNLYSDWEDQTYCVNSTEDEDYQWSLMKLQASFPHYEKDVLETLLKECNGDLENVTQLLL
uniref:CUE domain-containing protein n=1 Tax=Callorhinchus milii TaxID=7868 RepID=A0A4W3HAV0_CALMI|eukprot:gi/632977484/ref/XP_007905371.1/ PREDICTED: epithelial-stromal interaction protein 1 isoform X2 [Callorhinchus milii]